jgi:hypothetical protein
MTIQRVRTVIVVCLVVWMAAITWMLADIHGYLADLHSHDAHHWAAERANEAAENRNRLFEEHQLEEQTKRIQPYRSPEDEQRDEQKQKLTDAQEEQAKKDAIFAAEGRHRPLTRLEEMEALEQVKRDLAKAKGNP